MQEHVQSLTQQVSDLTAQLSVLPDMERKSVEANAEAIAIANNARDVASRINSQISQYIQEAQERKMRRDAGLSGGQSGVDRRDHVRSVVSQQLLAFAK